ncbi:uncharacterized protein [Drosophila bipectinata]|uniref:uncharacterized protein isoform X1 n=1 Tax=Drosophila bipectinata TaxID=42026 RepID=UPI0038B3EA10
MTRIDLRVRCPSQRQVDFHISVKMPLQKMMKAYTDYCKIPYDRTVFRVRGLRIEDTDTAEVLSLRNNDVVHVTEMKRLRTNMGSGVSIYFPWVVFMQKWSCP